MSKKDTQTEQQVASTYCPIKADLTNRVLAKFIDLLIASTILLILPDPVGILGGLTYILIADGMPGGQSLGKKFIGLKVVIDPMSETLYPCDWKKSIIRNIPFALAGGVYMSIFGIILFLVGVTILVFEAYFVFADDQGIRLGDILAKTKVLGASK